MYQSLDVMKAALNVLTALSQKRDPDPHDIAALTEFSGPPPEGMDLDEFACVAIQDAISRRAATRRRSEM